VARPACPGVMPGNTGRLKPQTPSSNRQHRDSASRRFSSSVFSAGFQGQSAQTVGHQKYDFGIGRFAQFPELGS